MLEDLLKAARHAALCAAVAADTPRKGLSVEGVFLVIACVGLSIVVIMIVFMIARLRKLRVDPSSYQNLSGKFNEVGQLSA